MLICKVVGHVWATKKDDGLNGLKLMVVQEIDGEQCFGHTFVAADIVGAGIGERVLVVGGSTARKRSAGKIFLWTVRSWRSLTAWRSQDAATANRGEPDWIYWEK